MDRGTQQEYAKWTAYFQRPFLQTVACTFTTEVSLSKQQLQFLLEVGLLRHCPQTFLDNALGMKIFTVVEWAKKRLRLIVHTVDINNCTEVTDGPPFEPLQTMIEDGLRTSLEQVWTQDIAAYYHQFPLEPDAQPFYSFMTELGPLCLTTIATGQRQCVPRAQLAAQAIATKAQLPGRPYIDNFRSLSPKFHETAVSFHTICTVLNVTLNATLEETLQAIGKPYEFRGVLFQEGTAHLAPKTKMKLMTAHKALQFAQQWTLHDVQSVFGLCIYATSILRSPTSSLYHIFKFVRRRCNQITDANALAHMWPSIVQPWRLWIEQLCSHPGRTIFPPGLPEYTVVSDASRTGYGGYAFMNGSMSAVGGKWHLWTQRMPICELEALALKITLERLVPLGASVTCRIDNMSVKGALEKGRSRSFWLNQHIAELTQKWHIKEVQYVRSADNIADPISRGELPQWDQLGVTKEAPGTLEAGVSRNDP